ncbi:hypothetical protein NT6N_23710 [Oceaniferula spumae]|uniref:Uncharacterized protein n=1 Tax=Oceaniferula spumae TaxID=2979115 RepID=A0AAT9FMU1_9BACT
MLLASDCYFFTWNGRQKLSSVAIEGDQLNMTMKAKIKKLELTKAKSIIAYHQGLGVGRKYQIQINLTEAPAKGVFPMVKIGDDIIIERVSVSGGGNSGLGSTISIEGDKPEQIKKWVELLRVYFKLPKEKVSIRLTQE